MKKRKGFMSLLMVCVLALSCTVMSFAASNVPTLTLVNNEHNSNGERYIKVSWEGSSGTYQVQLDEDKNFRSPITKKRTSTQGKNYNFVLDDNVDATYYARVRLSNGQWSNVVVAEMENTSTSAGNAYFSTPSVPTLPNISGNITLSKIKIGSFTSTLFSR